jgi:hypothetical protein
LQKTRRDQYAEEDLHASLFASERIGSPAFGDDLHHVILGCRPVETMPEGFPDDGMS